MCSIESTVDLNVMMLMVCVFVLRMHPKGPADNCCPADNHMSSPTSKILEDTCNSNGKDTLFTQVKTSFDTYIDSKSI